MHRCRTPPMDMRRAIIWPKDDMTHTEGWGLRRRGVIGDQPDTQPVPHATSALPERRIPDNGSGILRFGADRHHEWCISNAHLSNHLWGGQGTRGARQQRPEGHQMAGWLSLMARVEIAGSLLSSPGGSPGTRAT